MDGAIDGAAGVSRSGGEELAQKRGLSLLLRKSSAVEASELALEKALTLLDLRMAVWLFLDERSGFGLPLLVVEEEEGFVRLFFLEEDLKAETAMDLDFGLSIQNSDFRRQKY